MMIQKHKATATRKIALTAILAAVAVALSPFASFDLGFAKPNPVQHMVNAIAGVLLGPWYAVLIAVIVGFVRNILHVGSPLAFPGGVFGGLVVGLVHQYVLRKDYAILCVEAEGPPTLHPVFRFVLRRDYAAFFEPMGTGPIGATLSAYIVGPWAYQAGLLTSLGTLQVLMTSFLASSIMGSVLGFVILKVVHRTGLWA